MYISKLRYNKAYRIVNGEVLEQWNSVEAEVTISEGENPKDAGIMAENHINSEQERMNSNGNKSVKPDSPQNDEATEALWQLVVKKLNDFEFREDAQEYLDSTEFKMTIDAKKIVNSKPPKNK